MCQNVSYLETSTPPISGKWVVVYSVMQAYVSPALENNSEVGERVQVRRSISCVCTSAFQLSTKEADSQLTMGPPERGFGDSPYLLSGGLWFGTNYERARNWPGILFHGLSGPTLVP